MTTRQSEKSHRALALRQANEKPNPAAMFGGEQLISRAELRNFVNVSDMCLWRWLRAGKFPAPVYIGTRRFWRSTDLARWLQSKQGAQHGTS